MNFDDMMTERIEPNVYRGCSCHQTVIILSSKKIMMTERPLKYWRMMTWWQNDDALNPMIVGYREYCHHIIKNTDKTNWLMKKEIIDLLSSSGFHTLSWKGYCRFRASGRWNIPTNWHIFIWLDNSFWRDLCKLNFLKILDNTYIVT